MAPYAFAPAFAFACSRTGFCTGCRGCCSCRPVSSAVIVRLFRGTVRGCYARQMIGTGGDASVIPWLLLVVARSRSASMQKKKKRVCVVFVFIFTKISIISAILYPKTYKMYVILHFLRKIFGSFKKMYYLCSAFEKIK